MSEWNDPFSPDRESISPETSVGYERFSEDPRASAHRVTADGQQRLPWRSTAVQFVVLVAVVTGAIAFAALGSQGDGTRRSTSDPVLLQSSDPPRNMEATTRVAQATGISTTIAHPSSKAVPVLQLLALITVANEYDSGYNQDLFGYPGVGDGAGCDTRDRVLAEESLSLAQVAYPGCQVVAGDWLSLYDLAEFADPAELEVDHVVALKEAWDSGAWEWSPETLVAFGNDTTDPRTLRAVSVSTNRSKGDKDPSNWMPPKREVWCQYLADWVVIKVRWGLTMDQSEFGRIDRLLRNECQDTVVEPYEPALIALALLPIPDPDPDPDAPLIVVPTPGYSNGSESVYFSNCAEARSAGAAPLYIGDAGYRAGLDRDSDGVACE